MTVISAIRTSTRASTLTPLITCALYAVEKIPDADVRLTDAGSLLVAARIRLADYVDGVPGIVTRPIQTLSTDAGQ